MSQGSNEELAYDLLSARDLGYVKEIAAFDERQDAVGRMLRRRIERTLEAAG
jgi:hypothetical protein